MQYRKLILFSFFSCLIFFAQAQNDWPKEIPISNGGKITIYQPQPENIAFHLSFITALEFTSQLAIVYLHHWAQLKDKTNEVWLVKSICEVGSPITNPDCIEVYMQVKSIRKFQGKVYANQEFFITDHNQGQMRIELTGLMEL